MRPFVYDMTFWGFTEEEVSAERKKLEDAAADIERVRYTSGRRK